MCVSVQRINFSYGASCKASALWSWPTMRYAFRLSLKYRVLEYIESSDNPWLYFAVKKVSTSPIIEKGCWIFKLRRFYKLCALNMQRSSLLPWMHTKKKNLVQQPFPTMQFFFLRRREIVQIHDQPHINDLMFSLKCLIGTSEAG